ncbi:hypothetical protein CFP56_034155 [Quercus suber]|uniref:Uncharacterized protein n=1 Tax=Quercus suber TaxID=58331 RepID=A0AAW0LSM2_QUESU
MAATIRAGRVIRDPNLTDHGLRVDLLDFESVVFSNSGSFIFHFQTIVYCCLQQRSHVDPAYTCRHHFILSFDVHDETFHEIMMPLPQNYSLSFQLAFIKKMKEAFPK